MKSLGIAWQNVDSRKLKWYTGAKRTIQLRGFWFGQCFIGFARSVPDDTSFKTVEVPFLKEEYD